MNKEKIYIAGKVSGDPCYKMKFAAGVRHLEWLGWERRKVVNPVTACPEGWGWWRCMARCLRLLAGCGWVAMLPDWEESRGARIEHRVARLTGKWIIYIGSLGEEEQGDCGRR